jgi:hypothetical protein
MHAQLLSGDFGRGGVDQDEGEDARRRPAINPGVRRAALPVPWFSSGLAFAAASRDGNA